ncbi:MAG: hypothetical protein IKH31_08300 [Clostridia bacterium]|nr:hypothetical protein [Clostridia bacterium]MBQ4448555.1 hypothetical protein [Clostridia bacterium]MBR3487549.1 hypothetical protein [Clostridia bacterium]
MIKVLYGGRGEGMSRELCDLANERMAAANGSIVFIDKDDKHIYDLDRNIRLVNASEYGIEGPKMLTGFLSGISAMDRDVEAIYICSFVKIVKHSVASLEGLFSFLKEFAERFSIDFIIEMNAGEECPEFIKPLL